MHYAVLLANALQPITAHAMYNTRVTWIHRNQTASCNNTIYILTTDIGTSEGSLGHHFDGLKQKRHNSMANALELRLFCIKPSI